MCWKQAEIYIYLNLDLKNNTTSRNSMPQPCETSICTPGPSDLLLLLSRFSRVRLCDPRDGSPPGSPVPGILQARTLEWVAISFSNAWKWKVKVKSLSCVWLLETPWTAAHQAPSSIGFSRQEYWSGVPWPSSHLTCLRSQTGIVRFFFFF